MRRAAVSSGTWFRTYFDRDCDTNTGVLAPDRNDDKMKNWLKCN